MVAIRPWHYQRAILPKLNRPVDTLRLVSPSRKAGVTSRESIKQPISPINRRFFRFYRSLPRCVVIEPDAQPPSMGGAPHLPMREDPHGSGGRCGLFF